jgi:hypothetical protein
VSSCARCEDWVSGDLYEVIPLDTDPDVYDLLYAEKYCLPCAKHLAELHRAEPPSRRAPANPPVSEAVAGPHRSAPGSRPGPRPT